MTDTLKRNQATKLAQSAPDKALTKARSIADPWFRAQALAVCARFSPTNVVQLAAEAAKAAQECDDRYKQAAVRAWEVAALAERDHPREAHRALAEALKTSRDVSPVASRAEALLLLLQAATRLGENARDSVHQVLRETCRPEDHWRTKRALRDAEQICDGSQAPRAFFW